MKTHPLRVLLIEDDEDDFVLVRQMLSQSGSSEFELEWAATSEAALDRIRNGQYNVCLLDYRLDGRDGLDLLNEMVVKGLEAPVIFLTGQADHQVGSEAMQAGASDFLVKTQLDAPLLERSIRYAVERRRSEEALNACEKRVKMLSSQLSTVQEIEGMKIAGELEDHLGQVLSAIKSGVENVLDQMSQGAAVPGSMQALVPLMQYAIEEAQRIYALPRPSLLDDLGILAALSRYCREFQNIYPGIKVRKQVDIEEKEVPASLKTVIYKLVQEAMHNVARHSMANIMDISLMGPNGNIELMIKDNGIGFEMKDAAAATGYQSQLGLASMKERAELTGGSLTIESARGAGTTIRALWPLRLPT